MRNGVDNRIEDRRAFGNQSWQNGDQRRDLILISDRSLQANGSVRCPSSYPQSDVHHGDLGNTDLRALGFLVGIGTERGDVHLLSLITERIFVMNDGAHNVTVAENDDKKWNTVIEGKQAVSEGNSLLGKYFRNYN
jgi:hypothetical protein